MSESSTEKFKLYGVNELLTLSEPAWLIERLLTVGSLAALYGPSGEGKSFLALDWALSVAQGTEWNGCAVQQGAVVYVAAEGGRSIRKRVKAWMVARGVEDVPDAFFLLDSVQVRDRENLTLLTSRIEEDEIEPALIVLDTLARCFVGGEENSAKEMGEFVDGLERLRRETGAAVMVVHHTGKGTKPSERGSTALRGAADVMIRVSMDNQRLITVTNNKQKDDEKCEPTKLRLRQVVVAEGPHGEATSCVLVPADKWRTIMSVPDVLRRTLAALAKSGHGDIKTKDWQGAAIQAGVSGRKFYDDQGKLEERGCVQRAGKGLWRLTEKGLAASGLGTATATELQTDCNYSLPSTAATATTP